MTEFETTTEAPLALNRVVSGMYVNEDGFLMVGPDGKSTSIVEGIRCEWADTYTLELLIQPINDLGGVCGTYYR